MTARILHQYGIRVAHKPMNTLRRTISTPKDRIPATEKSNIIYKIPCNNCKKHYVGQTSRKLSTRLNEHRLALKRHDPLSLMSIHQDQEGHEFNLEQTTILDQAQTRHARELSESWYSNSFSINRKIELDYIYTLIRPNLHTSGPVH